LRKTTQWLESNVRELASTVPVSVDQDSGDRQQKSQAAGVKTQTSGQYMKVVLVEQSDKMASIIPKHFLLWGTDQCGEFKKKNNAIYTVILTKLNPCHFCKYLQQ